METAAKSAEDPELMRTDDLQSSADVSVELLETVPVDEVGPKGTNVADPEG